MSWIFFPRFIKLITSKYLKIEITLHIDQLNNNMSSFHHSHSVIMALSRPELLGHPVYVYSCTACAYLCAFRYIHLYSDMVENPVENQFYSI